MSAFDAEMGLDMNKIPTDILERAYWRRRLPPGFRFFLEMLSREILTAAPRNVPAHCAGFFEELLIQRDMELCMLPHLSYLNKVMAKRGLQATWPMCSMAGLQQPQGAAGNGQLPPAHRCARCGCTVCSAPSLPPARKAPPPNPCDQCGRCGRRLQASDGDAGLGGVDENDDAYSKVRIIPLQYQKDVWGRMTMTPGRQRDENELINSRSLSILMDY